jgi:hypothetical protein
MKYRLDGCEKRLPFGGRSAISFAQARKLRDAADVWLAAGEDLCALKKEGQHGG